MDNGSAFSTSYLEVGGSVTTDIIRHLLLYNILKQYEFVKVIALLEQEFIGFAIMG